MSSEDGAASAASWSKILLNLVLKKGTPRDDASEDVLLLAVVCHRGSVALLSTSGIDDTDGESCSLIGLFSAYNFERVNSARRQALSSRRGRQAQRVGASSVRYKAVDLGSVVWVRLFVQRDAD